MHSSIGNGQASLLTLICPDVTELNAKPRLARLSMKATVPQHIPNAVHRQAQAIPGKSSAGVSFDKAQPWHSPTEIAKAWHILLQRQWHSHLPGTRGLAAGLRDQGNEL